MFNIFSNSSVGIDIIDSSLKLVFLSKKAKAITLEHYNEIPLTPGIVVNGEIKDVKKFQEHLLKLTQKIKGNKKGIGEVVSSPLEKNTFTILIDKKEGTQNLKKNKKTKITPEPILEAIKEKIPMPVEEIYFDWQESCRNKILLSAANKSIIDNYMFSFKEAGLPLTIIDIKVAALIRAISDLWEQECSETKIIIHIGELYSTIVLGNIDMVEFSMNIPFSEEIANKIIANKLKISKNEAQKKKKVCGLSDKECKGEIKKILQPHLEEVISNIRRAILFRQENIKDPVLISKVFLCGHGANLKGLDKILTKELKIDTVVADPLININKNSIDHKKILRFTAAIGMALRGLI